MLPICYLFIDTEFTDFESLSPISLGISAEDGKHEFYREFIDCDMSKASEFVYKRVIPLLEPEKYGGIYQDNSLALINWINDLPYREIFFLADYQGDLNIIEKLINMNVELISKKVRFQIITKAFTQACHERYIYNHLIMHKALKCILIGIQNALEKQPQLQHHALNDARANRDGWNLAMEYLKSD